MSSVLYKGGKIEKLLTAEQREKVIADTMVGGATITKLMGTSAYYAPGACAASIVRAILHDEKRIIPCSVPQNGEYGEDDICLGVPVVIGKDGVEGIVKGEAEKHQQDSARTRTYLKFLTVFSTIFVLIQKLFLLLHSEN